MRAGRYYHYVLSIVGRYFSRKKLTNIVVLLDAGQEIGSITLIIGFMILITYQFYVTNVQIELMVIISIAEIHTGGR